MVTTATTREPRAGARFDPAVLRRLAIHEAGHALAACLLDVPLHPQRAMVLGDTHGYTVTARLSDSDSDRIRDATVAAAGWAALPFYSAGHHDMRQVRQLVDAATAKVVWRAARQLLAGRTEQLRAIAGALLDARTLTARQVHELVNA